MKKIITLMILLLAVILGEFSPFEKFDEFICQEYGVSLIYRGSDKQYLMIWVLSSPENPVVVGGYGYYFKSSTSTSVPWTFEFCDAVYDIFFLTNNKVKIQRR
jgi:hypothetical protein